MMDFADKFLPTQWENKQLSKAVVPEEEYGDNVFDREMYHFLCDFNKSADYSAYNLELPKDMTLPEMASNPITIAFLQFLITMHRPVCVVEIGSFIGLSALKMAEVMPYGSRLFTIEKGEEFADLALTNLARFRGVVDIALHQRDALQLVREWAEQGIPFADFVFLDGDKEHYDEYLEPLDVIMRPKALLVVDDAFFHGDVLNPAPTTDKGWGVKRFLEMAAGKRWSKVLLPISNGILLMQKPGH